LIAARAHIKIELKLRRSPMPPKDEFLAAALAEAEKGRDEGGIPIVPVLVRDGVIIGRGHNRRVQEGSVIHHAEMNCLENPGRLAPSVYREATLYTTLSPCSMCAGAAALFGVKKVVSGENRTFEMSEDYLRSHGIEVEVVDDAECHQILQDFIRDNPELWEEDAGGK
jgi:cytosine deaminase